jgi:putative FmdB family regulatory protein
MAIYTYECKEHGRFELTRPMAESDEDGKCPKCETMCERIRFVDATIAHDYKGLWYKNNRGYAIGDDRK